MGIGRSRNEKKNMEPSDEGGKKRNMNQFGLTYFDIVQFIKTMRIHGLEEKTIQAVLKFYGV